MGFASDWLDSTRQILSSAGEFFQNENRRDGFGYPLKFAAFSFLLVGILNSLRTGVLGSGGLTSTAISLVSGIVGGLIGLFLGAAIIHLFVMLLGGENGYRETLAALAYASCISAVASLFLFVPVVGGIVNLVLGIFLIYVEIKGVEYFQGMSTGRAAAAVLLPATVLLLLIIALAFTGMLAMLGAQGQIAGLQGSMPPAP
ncbi:hypothetical protein AQV86_02065 [Nanohaloarchaea archaeon SG9]|nr:hypothetical protein AQV86_02065 [Nanohaloarchaea archaeon SG9]